MQPRTVDASNGWTWIACGWRLFVKNPGIWIAMLIIFFLIYIVLVVIPLVGALAATLLSPALIGGLLYGARQLDSGGTLEIGHLFQGFVDKKKMNPLLTVGAVALAADIVIVIVTFVFIGGSVMAIQAAGGDPSNAAALGFGATGALAALVILTFSALVLMALFYAPALVMLGDVEPMEALKSSFKACLKNWLPLLIFGIVYLILAIIAIIPFGLGLIVLGPVTFCALYCSYRSVYD